MFTKKLSKVYSFGSQDVESFTFREPLAKDLGELPIGFDGKNAYLKDFFPLIASVTDQPLALILKLNKADMMMAVETMVELLGKPEDM